MNNNIINIVSYGRIRFSDRFFDITRFKDTMNYLLSVSSNNAKENTPEYFYFWYLSKSNVVQFLPDGTIMFDLTNISGAFTANTFMDFVRYLSRFCKENCYHDTIIAGINGSLMKENSVRINFDPNAKKSGYIIKR